jgi:DNA mismatch endonuclease (patch repair protein)
MAKLRGKDTRPESILKDVLVNAGAQVETHPGHVHGWPDLVSLSHRIAVFVNGCFWHQHGCRRSGRTRLNQVFWTKKFQSRLEKDSQAQQQLRDQGWKVIVLWECSAYKRKTWCTLLRLFLPGYRPCKECLAVAEPGRTRCGTHAAYERGSAPYPKHRVVNKEPEGVLCARRYVLDLCHTCGMPAATGHAACPEHLAHALKKARARLKELHANDQCRCGKPLQPGHKRCADCLLDLREKANIRYEAYKRAGRCRFCTKRAKRAGLCLRHWKRTLLKQKKYSKDWRDRQQKRGLCDCGRPQRTGLKSCGECRRDLGAEP